MSQPAPIVPANWREWTPRVVLAWLLIAVIAIIRSRDEIAAMALGDQDDVLRLLQVRALLEGQGWYDLVMHRIDPPAGVAMHWSRLVDLPIALCIAALTPLVGAHNAEIATVVIVPMLTLLAALLLTGRIAARLAGPQAAFFAALLWLIAFPARNQIDPLRIDHHGWQIVAVLAALNGLVARSARVGGWIVGASLGLGMAISIELLPFTGFFAGIFALRWISAREHRAWLVHMLESLAITSLVAFAVTRGPDITGYCDAVSPGYLAGFVLAALLVRLAARLPHWKPVAELGVLGVCGAAAGALLLLLAPQCSTGPFAQLDPVVHELWLANVLEGMPVWRQDIEVLVQMMLPPVFALVCAAALWRHSAGAHRRAWLEIALLQAASIVIALAVARFSAVACAIAAIPIGCALRPMINRMERLRSPLARVGALFALVLVLVPGVGVLLVYKAAPSLRPAQSAATAAEAEKPFPQCGMPDSLDALAALPKGTVFAPLDMGPALLLRTHHSVVATGHHRAGQAIKDLLTAFTASPDKAEALVRRHGATYVLTCDEIGETGVYKAKAPAGFAALLVKGKAPAWLEPVSLPAEARTLKLWRVR